MIDIQFLSDLALEAGSAILDVYKTDFTVHQKQDLSPLTLADTRSHEIICKGLRSQYADIPVLSEEGREVPFDIRNRWERFWLVDPLDGTKEFIKRNDEFTVNIALIEGGRPVVGVIYVPVLSRMYVADTRKGCWEIHDGDRRLLEITTSPDRCPIRIVASRSHPSAKMEELLKMLPPHALISKGSSLKFCAVAAGEADFYPRMGPTWEWDTAAGHAIIAASGGVVIDTNGKELAYNKEDLLNGPFLVAPSLAWLQETGILEKMASLL